MYKMLIVDDEALARYAFRTLVAKNCPDIEIVDEAESGSQAIEMNRRHHPDIIIMDIKMPGINGIDASREILNESPGSHILIVTAYDNFNYVQQALDIGVRGYLLKPINKEEVLEKIGKVLKDIADSRNQSRMSHQVESKINVVKPFIEKELISAFISGDTDISEVKSYIHFLQEKLEGGYFMLLSFGGNYSNHINDSVRNRIFRDKVSEAVARYLPLMKRCIFGNPIGNTVVVFIPLEPLLSMKGIVDEALVIAQEIKRKVKTVTGIDIAIGLGASADRLELLKVSFEQASQALRVALRENGICHYNSLSGESRLEEIKYPLQKESELLEQIRIGNLETARLAAQELLSELFSNHPSPHVLKEYIGQLITLMKRTLLQLGIGTELLSGIGQLAELNGLLGVDDIKVWSRNCIFSLMDLVLPVKQNKDHSAVRKVYEYINREFCNNITLESAAEEIGLSPQYLSKLFKEEFGKNFIDYLTEKRIQYAGELLRSTNGSIREISSMAGYIDANYFCRIFKKVTGFTPSEYRERK